MSGLDLIKTRKKNFLFLKLANGILVADWLTLLRQCLFSAISQIHKLVLLTPPFFAIPFNTCLLSCLVFFYSPDIR